MRISIALLLLVPALAVPNASAGFCDGDPSALAEVCTDDGSVSGYMHSKEVETSGCLIDINGKCVPRSASVQDGKVVGMYDIMTFYVGVDANAVCPFLPAVGATAAAIPHGLTVGSCGASYDTAPPTAYAMGVLF